MSAKQKRSAERKEDTSPYAFQRRKSKIQIEVQERIPWTAKQKSFIELAEDKNSKLIFLTGPAGTSKTIISVYCALRALRDKKVSDVIYIRSVVESASRSMGYLPGTAENKLDVYLEPLLSKLEELLHADDKRAVLANKLVAGMPVNYLRGSHFAGKYIIADESQNFDINELTTIMTRIGEYCKVILCGDTMQSDISKERSALKKLSKVFNSEEARANGIFTFEFGKEDIVRSELVKYIVGVLETLA